MTGVESARKFPKPVFLLESFVGVEVEAILLICILEKETLAVELVIFCFYGDCSKEGIATFSLT